MVTLLTKAEQDEHLDLLRGETLDNFSMTRLVLKYIFDLAAAGHSPPALRINFVSPLPASIPGTNCGFFLVPVIKMAMIDCRRSLEFFGLSCDHKRGKLTPITQRLSDDLGIEHFGLARITPAQFISVTSSIVQKPVEPTVLEVHKWSNKELAHFTLTKPKVELYYRSIHDAVVVMLEAYHVLLFDALGRQRPELNPSP